MKILVKCDYVKKMIAQSKDIYSKFSGLLLNLFLLYPSSPMEDCTSWPPCGWVKPCGQFGPMSCEHKEHATSGPEHLNTRVRPSRSLSPLYLSPLSIASLYPSPPPLPLSSLSLSPRATTEVQDGGCFIILGSSECCTIKNLPGLGSWEVASKALVFFQ